MVSEPMATKVDSLRKFQCSSQAMWHAHKLWWMRLGLSTLLVLLGLSFVHASPVPSSEDFLESDVKCPECAEGYRLLSAQKYRQAEVFWRDILKSSAGQAIKKAVALQQIANAQQFSGRFAVAQNSLRLAINALENINAKTLLGSLYYQLGAVEVHLGQLSAATLSLQNAMRLLDVQSNARANAVIQNKIGELYTLQQKPDQALIHYSESFDEFESIKNHRGAMIAARNVILSSIALQQYQLAMEYFSRALKLVETDSKEKTSIITAKIALVDTLNAFPIAEISTIRVKYVHAALLLKQIYQTPKIDSFNEVYSLGVIAELYFKTGQLDQAQAILSKAIMHSQALGSNHLLVRNLMLSGAIYRAQSKLDRAIQAYQLAVSHYEPLGVVLFRGQIGRGNETSLYLSLADLLLAKALRAKNPESAQTLLIKARDVIERQKITELQNYFNNTCDIPSSTAKTKIDAVINKHSAAIYPIILPDRIVILVSFSTGIQQFVINEDAVTVAGVVNEFRANLENSNTNAYLKQAQKIYSWVIRPLESEFKRRNISTIVVVSAQMFRTIPLAVLHDGKQYLVEKYALAVVPGLQLVDPHPLSRKKLSVLLSGISEAVQGYPPLRYVKGELEEIQDLYVTKLLMNKEFVTKNFEQAMRDQEFTIAHLASHSEFGGNLKDSYILTYDGKMSMQRLGDITSLTRRHKQPIELLTLSSCQTAVGDDKAALGLAGVAIKAGARSALATLWSIDDFASSILVSEFYKQLLNTSLSKAQALQRAQLKLIRSRRFDHPAYWSSFLLIGNWL